VQEPPAAGPPGDKSDSNAAMRRLVYLVVIGSAIVLVYGLCACLADLKNGLGGIAVSLMAGGAALLSGGLLGFVFGIPHTRLRDDGRAETSERQGEAEAHGNGDAKGRSATYRPNTSLEQISDWLTKMLVGVGLVEVKVIPGKLREVSGYLAAGLGGGPAAEAFILSVLIYFSVTGFVFGFLWARLYLPRWFAEADEVKQLKAQLSLMERRQQGDAKALELAIRLLNPQDDNIPVPEADLKKAVKEASVPIRSQIFYQAQSASEDKKSEKYELRLEGAISIFRALIASDSRERYHRNHAELSYALRRKKPQDLAGAELEIAEAIRIRDRWDIKGWKYYELHRARCIIEQDPDFRGGARSDSRVTERIMAHLRAASSNEEKWPKWSNEGSVGRWMQINGIDPTTLQPLQAAEPAG
jgi:hypothetical protein